MDIEEEPRVAEYLALAQQAAGQRASLRAATFAPKHALPFLQPGRLVRLLASEAGGGSDGSAEVVEEATVWGAILNFERIGVKVKGAVPARCLSALQSSICFQAAETSLLPAATRPSLVGSQLRCPVQIA